ncbi:MAG: hypothetical protein H7Z21_12795 [Hymenobacter sp.]|nr:hypothetical protein [Hymenobacter sp.]
MIEVDLIKKHGKKALGMEEHGHQKQTWRQRLPDILLEIGIIVFAVTLSIQLHAWHEHSLSREKERKFLVGLRQDLRQDLAELGKDSAAYVKQIRGFRYFRGLTPQAVSLDSFRYYKQTLRSATKFLPNDSRFEGLKASGGLDIIEEEELLSGVLDHYQEMIPKLVQNAEVYVQYKRQNMTSYVDEHLQSKGGNLVPLMASEPMQNYLDQELVLQYIVLNYHEVMQHSRRLIRQVDARLAGH